MHNLGGQRQVYHSIGPNLHIHTYTCKNASQIHTNIVMCVYSNLFHNKTVQSEERSYTHKSMKLYKNIEMRRGYK